MCSSAAFHSQGVVGRAARLTSGRSSEAALSGEAYVAEPATVL